MSPNILPTAPLSEVAFVHDYFQLVFQDACFSIYNAAELSEHGKVFSQGNPGFCDALVGLIGQSLSSALVKPTLSLTFQGGAVLVVTSHSSGPEAWQYNSSGNPVVVEQNA